MMEKKARVVFMGTPDFAVPALDALVAGGYDVTAVVTQPDRRRGRGHKLSPSPVKTAAQEHGIPVIQMDRISSEDGVAQLTELAPDFLVTAAFGQILTDEVLNVPKYGCVNVHASLLPAYRGASPVTHAIMRGDRKTGITTMYTVRELDAGPILLQTATDIQDTETGGELTDRLARIGAETLVRTLDGILDGTVTPKDQDASKATYYARFPKQYGEIEWNRPAGEIVNFVRALNPEPGAYFILGEEKVGALRASVADAPSGQEDLAPGTIVAADPARGLLIAAGDGVVSLDIIRRQGAKAMPAADSLRGRRIPVGIHVQRRGAP